MPSLPGRAVASPDPLSQVYLSINISSHVHLLLLLPVCVCVCRKKSPLIAFHIFSSSLCQAWMYFYVSFQHDTFTVKNALCQDVDILSQTFLRKQTFFMLLCVSLLTVIHFFPTFTLSLKIIRFSIYASPLMTLHIMCFRWLVSVEETLYITVLSNL